ncbi:uncharacterized protein Z519_01433 [Cladophialophora bantiana CBS 173.52]|uniref:SET domain-containing protein n=1 Tax=Cladophialophora bantiana (strain ATCC 10958 / CBS 173.52 / CDC B-1940 / NIH 8579) TaxID=1442370 RepID=A0A0D2IM49_CLAB1|nr:uncharacterized protein Z519_01433 [Cladophialophora bantiana CBS 173.52]KIW97849.1 hypothetical protein Z519_01433 [Cladophialophora bantiana CBS 173.52]
MLFDERIHFLHEIETRRCHKSESITGFISHHYSRSRIRLKIDYKILEKGNGLFASHNIKRGDVIAFEYPILVCNDDVLDALSWQEQEELLRIAVSRLPHSSQKLLYHLTSRSKDPFLYLTGILFNNAGFSSRFHSYDHSLLYPEISLLNHDCAPNSRIRINDDDFAVTVEAVRGITSGEEITISYLSLLNLTGVHFQPFAKRQRSLRGLFGFQCLCSRCSEGESYDYLLERIVDLREASYTNTGISTIEEEATLRALYERIGLQITEL